MDDEIAEKLREAACIGDLALLGKCQNQGADLNSKNKINGWTALHWACKRNQEKVVRQLLASGADKSITNNDGHTAAQVTSSDTIREILGATDVAEVKQSESSLTKFTPNYLANPPFPYATKSVDERSYGDRFGQMSGQDSQVSTLQSQNTISNTVPYQGFDPAELVLKARLSNSDDKDFIEIELARSSLDYASLVSLMCSELGVDQTLVSKVRKLPDTVVRKDKDVRRLVDFQELELVLSNKKPAASVTPRSYNSIAPAKNTETILY